MSGERYTQFSLVAGGPFYRVLSRLGLLGTDGLSTWRTAFVLALLAWIPPAIAAAAQSLAYADYSGWGFFTDGTVYTRYLVAITAMIATERYADGRISIIVDQFLHAHLLDPGARQKFETIVKRADRQSSAPLAEGILLLGAVVWSWLSFYFVSTISVSGWEEWAGGGESHLSWAGTTAELLSNPIFLFLVLRWFWRFVVWTVLLSRISRLPLQLIAIHPDRAGGLSFLALFPGVFSGFVFALSCVVSSSLLKTMVLLGPEQQFIWLVIVGWVVLMALVFLAPLLFFMAPLYRVRELALIEYGRLVQVHHQVFHNEWISGAKTPMELLESTESSSIADLNSCVEIALGMRIVPLTLSAVLQTLLAATVPFLVVVASQVPLTDVLKWLVGAIM